MTREDAIQLDVLAAKPAPKHGMSYYERRQKNKHYEYRVVQTGSAGGHSVRTEDHPQFGSHRAKAKANTMSWAASSSTAWPRQNWTTEETGQAHGSWHYW